MAVIPKRLVDQEPFVLSFDHPGVAPVAATGLITCATVANLADTDYITIGDGINPPWVFEFDKTGDGASLRTEGYKASGTITCDTDANAADADIVTISDGINAAVVYEYDKSSNGVTAGRITVAAGTTAASNATALAALIALHQPDLTVADDLAGVLTLTQKFAGTFANITITHTAGGFVASATGLTGGVNPAAADGTMHGRKQVNVSADTTAAHVAARLCP